MGIYIYRARIRESTSEIVESHDYPSNRRYSRILQKNRSRRERVWSVERRMRILRLIGAAIATLISGSVLLVDNGLRIAGQERVREGEIRTLVPHPKILGVVYLAIGFALPLVSSWLTRPEPTNRHTPENRIRVVWDNFFFRLCFSVACSILIAFLLAFLTPSLASPSP